MRSLIFCLVLSLLFPSLVSASSENKECNKNCVEFTYTDNGYNIMVLGNAGDVVYNQSVRLDKPVATNSRGEKQIITLARGEILPANTTTTTTSTPIEGGGSIIVVTVKVNGVIISQTVIIVDAQGRVRRTVDTL